MKQDNRPTKLPKPPHQGSGAGDICGRDRSGRAPGAGDGLGGDWENGSTPTLPEPRSADKERRPGVGITAQVGWVTHISSVWVRTQWTAFEGRSLRARSLCAFLFCLLFLTPNFAGEVLGEGKLSDGEKRFIERTVGRWGLTDLARKWIDARLATGASAECDLLFYRADCYKSERNEDAYSEEIKKLQRRCPSHPRAQAGTLELIKAGMFKVIKQNEMARRLPRGSKRQEAFSTRDQMYRDILGQLETGIVKANDRVKENEEDYDQIQLRDSWEHYRVQAGRIWANMMDEGSKERKEAWEQVYAWASHFVDERWVNFVLQCECQLFKSEALAELGKTEEAAEEYDLLVEMAPNVEPPYPDPIKAYLRELRLKAITGTARAWNRVGTPRKAFEVFERVASNPDPDVDLAGAIEDPNLVRFVVDAKVEEAIARCAAADDDSGIKLFLELIEEYGEKEIAPGEVSPFRRNVVLGAARLLDIGCGLLPAIVYEYAGIGYQIEGRYREAAFAYKRALRSASRIDSKKARGQCAKLLDRIGQAYYHAGRPHEAMFTFHMIHEAYRRFGGSSAPEEERVIAARASQNVYSILSKLSSDSDTKLDAFDALRPIAEEVMVDHADLRLQAIVARKEGLEYEEKGDYKSARRVYQSIPREDKDGKLFPPYVELQSLAARALFKDKAADGKTEEGVNAAVKELEALEGDAKAAKVQTYLVFTYAEIYWTDGVRDVEKALQQLARLRTIDETADREQALSLWLQILIAEKRGKEADEVFAMLKKDFPKSQFILALSADLIELHLGLGAAENKAKAGEYAAFYTSHKDSGLDKMAPASLLFFGTALVDGGKVAEAKAILEKAEAKVTEDQKNLNFAVKMLLAKVQLKSGDYKECIELLQSLEKADPEIREGDVPDAHVVYQLRAQARLELYKESPKASLLEGALKDTRVATGLLQRLVGPNAPAETVRAYWESELGILKIWKVQKEWENVIKTVRSFSSMGALDNMPADLKEQFEAIRAECEKKQ